VRRVVITRLWGGLGNQLFQVAAGLALGAVRGARVVVDRRLIDTDDVRSFALDDWDLPVTYEVPRRLAEVPLGSRMLSHAPDLATLGPPLQRVRLGWGRTLTHVVEQPDSTTADPLAVEELPVVLSGYWQQWRTAVAARDVLRAAVLALPVSATVRAEAERLREERVISVHVRRTDYVVQAAAIHGAVDAGYVRDAVALVRRSVGERPVRVFSDDLAWCREHLAGIPDLTVPEAPGTTDEDLHLMTHCGGHVIANSSFSWWGALLAESGCVAAPTPWFRDSARRADALLPPDWVQVRAELGA
jgi:hypothetical protein